MKAISTTPVSS